jgi:hypothetical protein
MAPPKKDFEDRIDDLRDTRRHGEKEGRDRSDRPSWRERDRKKDRGFSSQNDPLEVTKSKDRYQTKQAQEALKGELKALFHDNAGDALRDAILQAEDRVQLQTAIDAHIDAKGGLPAHGEVLEKALDVRKDRTLRVVIEAIAVALPDCSDAQRKVLLLKMRNKKRRTFDNKVSKGIQALLDEYGVQD